MDFYSDRDYSLNNDIFLIKQQLNKHNKNKG